MRPRIGNKKKAKNKKGDGDGEICCFCIQLPLVIKGGRIWYILFLTVVLLVFYVNNKSNGTINNNNDTLLRVPAKGGGGGVTEEIVVDGTYKIPIHLPSVPHYYKAEGDPEQQYQPGQPEAADHAVHYGHRISLGALGEEYDIHFYWKKSSTNTNSTTGSKVVVVHTQGPHQVRVFPVVKSKKDSSSSSSSLPPITIKLVGGAIVPIPLSFNPQQQSPNKHDHDHWMGTFWVPNFDNMHYKVVEEPILGGSNRGKSKTTVISNSNGKKDLIFETKLLLHPSTTTTTKQDKEVEEPPSWLNSKTLFPPKGYWIHTTNIKDYPNKNNDNQQQYVWQSVPAQNNANNNKWITANTRGMTNDTDSYVQISSTVLQQHNDWFTSFRDLSNYEIVCWMGSTTAEHLMGTFLSMRQQLFPAQRPFKFHYHPMSHLAKPDITWSDDLKEKFRKCKHTFVVLDDDVFMETSNGDDSISATEYKQRLTIFLKHLVKAFPDPTFPIWLFSIVEESPYRALSETHHCYHSDNNNNHQQQQSSAGVAVVEHPCNRVMIDLLQNTISLFGKENQQRIRYLDNTDISMGMGTTTASGTTSSGPRRMDILAVIALRIYVIVGKQVQEWRSMGQWGAIDGLHRNGTVEPNKELIHYQWQ